MKEAQYYEKIEDSRVRCILCPHGCTIPAGRAGRCGIRINRNGVLEAATFGAVTSLAMDPIEKKPLYHFLPGSSILSVGQNGCNFDCDFCQNWQISRGGTPEQHLGVEELVSMAIRRRSSGIAYTYNEPLIAVEFVRECAEAARNAGLANVCVTNGFLNPGPLDDLLPFIDALNVDIKSMDDEFYKTLCKARLEPVLKTVERAARTAHVEVTHLVIPGENDQDEQFRALAAWLVETLGPSVPVHLSAYHPAHRRNTPPTPLSTLERARDIFAESLSFVYLGNVPTAEGRDTRCTACGAVLVERSGYATQLTGLTTAGACSACGASAPFIMPADLRSAHDS